MALNKPHAGLSQDIWGLVRGALSLYLGELGQVTAALQPASLVFCAV